MKRPTKPFCTGRPGSVLGHFRPARSPRSPPAGCAGSVPTRWSRQDICTPCDEACFRQLPAHGLAEAADLSLLPHPLTPCPQRFGIRHPVAWFPSCKMLEARPIQHLILQGCVRQVVHLPPKRRQDNRLECARGGVGTGAECSAGPAYSLFQRPRKRRRASPSRRIVWIGKPGVSLAGMRSAAPGTAQAMDSAPG